MLIKNYSDDYTNFFFQLPLIVGDIYPVFSSVDDNDRRRQKLQPNDVVDETTTSNTYNKT